MGLTSMSDCGTAFRVSSLANIARVAALESRNVMPTNSSNPSYVIVALWACSAVCLATAGTSPGHAQQARTANSRGDPVCILTKPCFRNMSCRQTGSLSGGVGINKSKRRALNPLWPPALESQFHKWAGTPVQRAGSGFWLGTKACLWGKATWPILEHFASLANPVPLSPRSSQIVPKLNSNDIEVDGGGEGRCALVWDVGCVRAYLPSLSLYYTVGTCLAGAAPQLHRWTPWTPFSAPEGPD
jgi:hypothetical protein